MGKAFYKSMRAEIAERIYREGNRLFTEIPEKYDKESVYGEKITKKNGRFLRSWNPYRSKLSAAILKNVDIEIKTNYNILYLGAATGTTVSHLSDILKYGKIYAVEISPFSIRKLLELCKKRDNIVPILADAAHPERYQHIVDKVDLLYQDISQRNQIEIFHKNCERFLPDKGIGILTIKSRSIDVTSKPERVYREIIKKIQDYEYKLRDYKKLDPYSKDHSVFVIMR